MRNWPGDDDEAEDEVDPVDEIVDAYYGTDSVVYYDNEGEQHCVPTGSWSENGC